VNSNVIRKGNDLLNEQHTEAWTGRSITKAVFGVILRVLGIVLWFIVYVGFMYSAEYAAGWELIVGVIALLIGAVAVLSPKKVLGEQKWFYAIYAFYALSLSLMVLKKL
jgi:hypothetical protein